MKKKFFTWILTAMLLFLSVIHFGPTELRAAAKSGEYAADETDRGKKKTEITISAVGDCTLGSDRSSPASVNFYSVYNRKKDPAYFFKRVKKNIYGR